ncbi:MAG: response regulator [Pyrinomonadaceae bacterium]
MTRPKLLLADDSVTIRKVVELTFADEEIDVSTVADAEAAMQKFVEIQPDIVLVDVGLSETNGYRICEMIKQDEATKHIPVLLLVGSFEPFDQDEAERVEADGFLTKPFHSIRDLVARVWDLLGKENTVETPDGQPEGLIITPETSDIAHLYNSRLAKTAEIEDFDTARDLLGDFGMDDEMIQASYPTEAFTENFSEILSVDAKSEQAKEFVWSPESMISETTPAQAKAAGFVFDETGEFDSEFSDGSDNGETPVVENISEPTVESNHGEPSPEFISLVAERVIEKLSDRVIREIAQTAVPRIAEKLIREALEEDRNSSQ